MKNKAELHLPAWVATILVLSGLFACNAFAQPEIRIEPGASCTTACHTDLAKKKKTVHAVAESGAGCATMCHQQADKGKHAFKPMPADKTQLCTMCHALPAKAHPHLPVKVGACTACHDPHQSDHGKLLKKAAPELCFTCHEPARFRNKVVHGPVAKGNCLGCHAPHASEKKKLLDQSEPELCLGCHSAQLKDAQGRSLPSTKSLLEDKEAKLHPPFAQGQCSFCHQPHASASARLTDKGYPADFYSSYSKASYGLCFTCHSSKKFDEPRTLTETQFRNGNLNLHHRHVNRDKGRSCGACHNPHGSRQPGLIRPAFQFGTKVLPIKFEKTDAGGSCTTACHVPAEYDRCDPVQVGMRTSPRQGQDASRQELVQGCEKKK